MYGLSMIIVLNSFSKVNILKISREIIEKCYFLYYLVN